MSRFEMKSLVIVMVMAAVAVAEPPPSHSYLPPSPVSRTGGYPQGPAGLEGAPQVVAARTLDQGHGQANGFARSGLHEQSPHGHAQGYEESSLALARNSLDSNSEPANYNFGYMVSDYNEGTDFGHQEERIEERAQGHYHVVLPDGRKQTVTYEADERGFKPQISYQDTEDLTRSNGYDANANNRNHGNGYDSNANHHSHGNGFKNGGHDDHNPRSGY